MKATILASTDEPEEVAAARAFLEQWRGQLHFVSEDQGCGCCVHIWEVEGPAEVVARIPARIRTWSPADDQAPADEGRRESGRGQQNSD